MSGLVVNPEDRVSPDAAHLVIVCFLSHYVNTPMQSVVVFRAAKIDNFKTKIMICFLRFPDYMFCEYMFEPPQGFYEYPLSTLNIYTPINTSLSI